MFYDMSMDNPIAKSNIVLKKLPSFLNFSH